MPPAHASTPATSQGFRQRTTPNAFRVNLGAYGNTPQASRSTATNNESLILSDLATVVVPEGGTNQFQLRLSRPPLTNTTVWVTFESGDRDIAISSVTNLVFTPTNWNEYQAVTVTAAHDQDAVGGESTVIAQAPGWTSQRVQVRELDDETAAVLTSRATVTVPEGSLASFGLKLSALRRRP